MLIIPSFLLALLFVLLVSALLRLPNRPAALIGAYLLFFTHILASLMIASALGRLSSRYIVLLVQLVLTAAAYIFWIRGGKPSMFAWVRPLLAEVCAGWKHALLRWPEICLLGAGVAGTFVVLALLVWIVPPNNNDSLSTHLSRIGYWLQHGSLRPWETFNTKQVFYPVNAALQVFWTVLMWGTDRLAGLVQWAGGLATIVTVFGMTRLMNWSRAQSAFAALIWGSFPVILLQSTTTQLDLVASAVFLPGLYYLMLAIKTGRRSAFVLAGLSLGLALGSKQTLLFLLPGLALFLLLQWGYWKKNPSQLAVYAASAAVFFVLLSSEIYIVNWAHFGHPLGPPHIVGSSMGELSGGDVLPSLKYNIPRLAYQFIDFSGMPRQIADPAYQVKAEAGQKLAELTGFSLEAPEALAATHRFNYARATLLSEDESWFGVLGFLLLLPAFIHQLIQGVCKKDSLRVGLGLFSLAFLPVNVVLRPGWDPFQGRYFITACAAAAPFMAVWVQPRLWSRVVRWAALVLAAVSIAVTLLYNPAKPLSREKINIFDRTRQDMQVIQGGMMVEYVEMIGESLPNDAVVGYYSPTYCWDYPLFGYRFTRTVIPIVQAQKLGDGEWLRSQGIEYVLINLESGSTQGLAAGLELVDGVPGEWALYAWKPGS